MRERMQQGEENLIISAIKILSHELHQNSLDKGFWEDEDKLLFKCSEDPKLYKRVRLLFDAEKIALSHSELSEGLEIARKDINTPDANCPEFPNFLIEMVDTVIRILEHCQRRNLPFGDALIAKHNFNLTRPKMHGKNN